jgi:hypothetical protein
MLLLGEAADGESILEEWKVTDSEIARMQYLGEIEPGHEPMGLRGHRFRTVKDMQFPTCGDTMRVFNMDSIHTKHLKNSTWVSFFEDADIIIFLAPVSAFDEMLDDGSETNRLEQSYELFKTICQDPLLGHLDTLLLFTRTDVLKEKIESGKHIKN